MCWTEVLKVLIAESERNLEIDFLCRNRREKLLCSLFVDCKNKVDLVLNKAAHIPRNNLLDLEERQV